MHVSGGQLDSSMIAPMEISIDPFLLYFLPFQFHMGYAQLFPQGVMNTFSGFILTVMRKNKLANY